MLPRLVEGINTFAVLLILIEYMKIFVYFSIITLLFNSQYLSAQCEPTPLCFETPVLDSLTSGNAQTVDCFATQNTSFFTFTTNNSPNNTEDVILSFEDVTFPDTTGDQSLQVVVIELLTSSIDPCTPSIWGTTLLCDSITSSSQLTIAENDLAVSTSYLVMVGNTDLPLVQSPTYSITASGMWLTIDLCCNQEIIQGDEAIVTALGSNTPLTWSVNTDTHLTENNNEVSLYPLVTTVVTAMGEVAGCEITEEVTIGVIQPVHAFNLFTPNGDGVNDVFEIANIEKYQNAIVTVFDRWGQSLHKSIGYTKPWDGTNNGRKVPAGTYYYVIELNSLNVDIPPITGYTTILY